MPFKAAYLVPDRVIILYLFGTLELQTFRDIAATSIDLISQGNAPVHTLTYIDPNVVYPKSVQAILEMVKTAGEVHPKTGWIIQITSNPIQRFLGILLTQLSGGNIRHSSAATLSEALIYVKNRDANLAAMEPAAVVAAFELWRAALKIDQDSR